MERRRITFEEWNELIPKVRDRSAELPPSFLVFGQVMRAKVELEGKVYRVSGWMPPLKPGFVEMEEVQE